MAKQINGKLLAETLTTESFPPKNYLKDFVSQIGLDFNPQDFIEAFKPSPEFQALLDSSLESGKSCGKPLLWSLLIIEPHKAFQLHAHPNIEINYVMKGTLYQKVLETCDLDTLDSAKCTESSVKTNTILLNLPGSIHQSFTKEEPVVLLCLFSSQWIFYKTSNDQLLPVTASKTMN